MEIKGRRKRQQTLKNSKIYLFAWNRKDFSRKLRKLWKMCPFIFDVFVLNPNDLCNFLVLPDIFRFSVLPCRNINFRRKKFWNKRIGRFASDTYFSILLLHQMIFTNFLVSPLRHFRFVAHMVGNCIFQLKLSHFCEIEGDSYKKCDICEKKNSKKFAFKISTRLHLCSRSGIFVPSLSKIIY